MFTLALIALAAIAYLTVGARVLQRGMNHIHANALTDTACLDMAIQNSIGMPSMRVPQITIVLLWPLALLLVAVMLLSGSWRSAAAA